ncbi:stabilizer of axonemal microtubules 5 [Sminthopsis crassicaudata]|uniref:stabilizer of axonemal microtubules 5 n=1 Tax=Sminthopsis crassicaudata TaxID=9301 RepID=UPI003D68C991
MADSPPKLLPAPLPREEFLRSSHFKIGADTRLQEKCMKTTFRSLFPPHWGFHAAAPFMPQSSKRLFHQDLKNIHELDNRIHITFPVHDINITPSNINPMSLTSSLKMHGDPRINVFKTIFQKEYTYPESETFISHKEARKLFDKDSFPTGDRDKLGIPLSHNRQVFVSQHLIPQPRVPSLHFGGPSPLKWGTEPHPESSYQKEFQGRPSSPAHICEKLKSILQLGDRRIGLQGIQSEQKKCYILQDLPQHRYNKKVAAANILQVNIQPGDGQTRAYLPSYKIMASMETNEPIFKYPAKKDSIIMMGDRDPERCRKISNFTNHHHSFTWVKPKYPIERVKEGKSNVIFGDKIPNPQYMVTTHQKTYLYPKELSSKSVRSHAFLKSHIKMGTNEMEFLTTSAAFGIHSVKKNVMPEAIKQKMGNTNILPPTKDQEFSTEYNESFPFKYIGPCVRPGVSCQESNVKLGLLQKRWSGRSRVIPG